MFVQIVFFERTPPFLKASIYCPHVPGRAADVSRRLRD